MRRISSRTTFFSKRIFPAIWFGFLLLFIAIPIFAGSSRGHSAPPFPFLVVPVIMMIFGYFMMRKLVFDLVDEVWEDGDSLVVRNRGEEQRIALRDVKNVSYSPYMHPPRVVLSLRTPTTFGDRIAFCAPIALVPFATSPLINDLIERIDLARQQQG
ncbi:MAG: hypothetical protein WBF58_17435 [Xanthobacteraceae bacterium]